MQGDKDYIVFILGYDLLQKQFLNSKEPECDLVYDKCNKIADDFLISEYNRNTKSLYGCIVDYINSERYNIFKKSLEEIKTLKGWNNSKFNTFEKYCKPGDIVDKDIVDYFLNSLPPISLREYYVQAGGAFDYILDKEDNLVKPTYTTFEKEDGKWVYKGNCFKGKNENVSYSDTKLNNTLDKETNQVGYIEESITEVFNVMKDRFNWKFDLNKEFFDKVLDKIKEDDELASVLDETIGSVMVEVKEKLEEEENEENERE